jgi:hypothetical protein
MDVYFCTGDGHETYGQNKLFENMGEGVFREAVEAEVDNGGCSYSAAWGDYDNDGYLDLLVANLFYDDDYPNELYRNNCDGTFTAVGSEVGININISSLGATFLDYNGDLYQDILFTTSSTYFDRTPVLLYENSGPPAYSYTLIEGAFEETRDYTNSGVGICDFDNDGDLDIFVPSEMYIDPFEPRYNFLFQYNSV